MVSGKPWKVKSQIPEGEGQYLITNWPGEKGLAGVVNGKLIRLELI